MIDWTPAALFEAESAALAKHCLAFLFFLVFLVYFCVSLRRRKRKGSEERRHLLLADAALGGLFLALLTASVLLLLFPQNALRLTGTEQQTETLRGTVSAQYLRPYLWAPSTAGSYGTLGGETLYLPGLRASAAGAAETAFLPGTNYALTFSSAAQEAALPYPWYLHAGRVLLLVSGLYIVARLMQISAYEAIQMKKQRDKTDPLTQYLDRL